MNTRSPLLPPKTKDQLNGQQEASTTGIENNVVSFNRRRRAVSISSAIHIMKKKSNDAPPYTLSVPCTIPLRRGESVIPKILCDNVVYKEKKAELKKDDDSMFTKWWKDVVTYLTTPYKARLTKGKDTKENNPCSAWWKRLCVSQEERLPQDERLMAEALSVTLRDLEQAIVPLRQLDLLYTQWPSVHSCHVEDLYGKCMKVAGKGTGGEVRLFKRKEDGRCFAIKQFRSIRSFFGKRILYWRCVASSELYPNR
jgi:hypothetical protein